MKCHNKSAISLILFLFFFDQSFVYAQQALVRVYENPALSVGQAFLTHNGKECIAILPQHVVDEAKTPSFLAEGHRDLMGEADLIETVAEDIAVARLYGRIDKMCGYGIATISRLIDQHLQNQGLGTLRSVNSDGTIANLPVAIIDNDGKAFIQVQATNENNQIQKGQSGSLLLLNTQVVGMLLSIKEAGDGTVYGKVVRLDKLLDSVESYMLGSINQKKPQHQTDTNSLTDLAAAHTGGQIIGWSSLPVDNQHRAANLISNEPQLFWRAKVNKWPTEIEIDLAGENSIINGIHFNGGNVPSEELPVIVEIFVNVNQEIPSWRSIASRALVFNKEKTAVFNFAPVWARQIKLNFSRTQGVQDMISLNKIRVTKP